MARAKFRNELAGILKHNKDGSYSTQAARERSLIQVGKDLRDMGYSDLNKSNFRTKHVNALVSNWKEQGLSTATIKNRLSHVRWYSEKIGKQNIVPRTNAELGIERRSYSNNSDNKAQDIDRDKHDKLNERYQLACELQREFGLRREESLKFQPSYADKGDHIELKDSWCKGGREREIPVETQAQRDLLDRCAEFAGDGSMISEDKTYYTEMKSFESACERAEIKNVHGFRHAYAQDRYKELTGRDCPKAGGETSRELTPEKKQQDHDARMQISKELGHNREEITTRYLGR
jgi:site-specific recombinase XerC